MPPRVPDLADEAAAFLADLPDRETIDGPRGGSSRHLLLPYTDTQPAQRALEAVVDLSSVFKAEVRVVHFREWEPSRTGRWFFQTHDEAVSLVNGAVGKLRTFGVTACGEVRDSSRRQVPERILASAHELRACAIVLGAVQHWLVTTAVIGSVSRAVMHRRELPRHTRPIPTSSQLHP